MMIARGALAGIFAKWSALAKLWDEHSVLQRFAMRKNAA